MCDEQADPDGSPPTPEELTMVILEELEAAQRRLDTADRLLRTYHGALLYPREAAAVHQLTTATESLQAAFTDQYHHNQSDLPDRQPFPPGTKPPLADLADAVEAYGGEATEMARDER